MMSHSTLTVDYWALVWPRFLQGLGLGFIFVPLVTLTLATIDRQKLGNATAAFNVLRNLGGSVGVALATTFLTRRSQGHQSVLAAHVNVWDPATAARLKAWTAHFAAQGADSFTAERQAVAMLYHDVVGQAQVLAYADDFWMLAVLFTVLPLAIPLMRRVRAQPVAAAEEPTGRVGPLPSAVE
jgi:DHA2 family multidrug resistance protein